MTPPPRPPPTRGRRLRVLALLMNGVLLVTGIYFELHPRNPGDVWSAGGIVAIAVLNSAAVAAARGEDHGDRVRVRLRRIALIANAVLVASGLLLAVAEGLRAWSHVGLHGLALVVPPLLTILALRADGPPGAGSRVASL